MSLRKIVILVTLLISAFVITGWVLNIVSLYLLIPVLLIYTIINILGSIKIQWNYFIRSFNKAETEDKIIAITFDDGPDEMVTSQLLKILDKHNAKATFFCIGSKVNPNKAIVESIINKGHIIGNHSFFHANYFDLLSSERMMKEIELTNNDIYKITGVKPLLFRPPFGVTNPPLRKALNNAGMTSIGWSLRTFDTVKDPDQVLEKIKNNTLPGDIVLFHDTLEFIPQVVDKYLDWIKEQGWKIVGLDKLLNIQVYEEQ